MTFREIFKPKPWGGRALARVCGKPLPPARRIGESWEIADHPHGAGVVAQGPLEGRTLHDVFRRHGQSLMGRVARGPRFPLLVKLLDARQTLSAQVHPDDRLARSMKLRDSGKTEAWYILESRPNGRILAGFASPRAARRLKQLADNRALGEFLRALTPRTGETWLCRAGTVHALGPGIVVLEVQQNSDATFRLHDWGRVGLDGAPRPLHLPQAIRAVAGRNLALRRGRVRPLKKMPFPAHRLLACDKFVLDRWHVTRTALRAAPGHFEILHVLNGRGTLHDAHWPPLRLKPGRTVLVPAGVRGLEINPSRKLTIVRVAQAR